MPDNMTDGTPSNALSVHDGVSALAELMKSAAPKMDTPQIPPAGEQAADAEADSTAVVTDEEPDAPSESEPETEEVVQLTLPNGERINAEEAVKGYLRQSDYTKKTQQLSQIERQRQDEHTQYIERLRVLADSMPQEKEPDWLSLLDQIEPREVQKAQIMWKQRAETKAAAKAAIEYAERQQLEQAFQNTMEVIGSGEFEPKWRDPKARDVGLNQVVQYGQDLGLSRQDLNIALTTPAAIIALEKARRWDELQKAKPKAIKETVEKPKVFTPGAKPGGKNSVDPTKTAINRLRQTNSNEDAIAALKSLRRPN